MIKKLTHSKKNKLVAKIGAITTHNNKVLGDVALP